MLSDPKKLRTRRGHGYLVSWHDRLRMRSESQAASVVERILEDADNVAALRRGIGRPDASEDDLREWIISGLAGGGLNLLKTKLRPRVFDEPPRTNLFDLLPPEPVPDTAETLTFAVSDNERNGVEARYAVTSPGESSSGVLAADDRRAVHNLDRSSEVTLELSALQLSLRPLADLDAERTESKRNEGAHSKGERGNAEARPEPGLDPHKGKLVALRVQGGSIERMAGPLRDGVPAQWASSTLTLSELTLSLPDDVASA